MIRVEHNVETGEILEIELSATEIKEFEKSAAARVSDVTKWQNKEDAKAALLERLGITAEEAALLLG
jgi:hypothetical protein